MIKKRMKLSNMNHKYLAGIIGLFVLVGVFTFIWQRPSTSFGSVLPGGEYISTTTANMAKVQSVVAGNKVVTLGSVIVASTSVQRFKIWDATSTTDGASTTVAEFKASIAEGTYTFDMVLNRGLIVETPTGFDGDYIVTFRSQ